MRTMISRGGSRRWRGETGPFHALSTSRPVRKRPLGEFYSYLAAVKNSSTSRLVPDCRRHGFAPAGRVQPLQFSRSLSALASSGKLSERFAAIVKAEREAETEDRYKQQKLWDRMGIQPKKRSARDSTGEAQAPKTHLQSQAEKVEATSGAHSRVLEDLHTRQNEPGPAPEESHVCRNEFAQYTKQETSQHYAGKSNVRPTRDGNEALLAEEVELRRKLKGKEKQEYLRMWKNLRKWSKGGYYHMVEAGKTTIEKEYGESGRGEVHELLRAYCTAGELEKAWQLYKSMLGGRIPPNRRTYLIMIGVTDHLDNVAKAQTHKGKDIAVSKQMSVHFKHKMTERMAVKAVLAFLSKIELETRHQPQFFADVAIQSALVGAFSQMGDAETAIKLAREERSVPAQQSMILPEQSKSSSVFSKKVRVERKWWDEDLARKVDVAIFEGGDKVAEEERVVSEYHETHAAQPRRSTRGRSGESQERPMRGVYNNVWAKADSSTSESKREPRRSSALPEDADPALSVFPSYALATTVDKRCYYASGGVGPRDFAQRKRGIGSVYTTESSSSSSSSSSSTITESSSSPSSPSSSPTFSCPSSPPASSPPHSLPTETNGGGARARPRQQQESNEDDVDSTFGLKLTPAALSSLAAAIGEKKEVREALAILNKLMKLDIPIPRSTFEKLLEKCKESGNFVAAERTLNAMASMDHRYGDRLEAEAAETKADWNDPATRGMWSEGSAEDQILATNGFGTSEASERIGASKVEAATGTEEDFYYHTIPNYVSLMETYVNGNNVMKLQAIAQWLNEEGVPLVDAQISFTSLKKIHVKLLEAGALPVPNLVEALEHYMNSFVLSCVEEQDTTELLHLLQEMKELRLTPKPAIYSILFCLKYGRKDRLHNLPVLLQSYPFMLNLSDCQEYARHASNPRELWTMYRHSFFDPNAYDEAEIETILREMRDLGIFPDLQCYKVLLALRSSANNLEKCMETVRVLKERGFGLDATSLGLLIDCLVQSIADEEQSIESLVKFLRAHVDMQQLRLRPWWKTARREEGVGGETSFGHTNRSQSAFDGSAKSVSDEEDLSLDDYRITQSDSPSVPKTSLSCLRLETLLNLHLALCESYVKDPEIVDTARRVEYVLQERYNEALQGLLGKIYARKEIGVRGERLDRLVNDIVSGERRQGRDTNSDAQGMDLENGMQGLRLGNEAYEQVQTELVRGEREKVGEGLSQRKRRNRIKSEMRLFNDDELVTVVGWQRSGGIIDRSVKNNSNRDVEPQRNTAFSSTPECVAPAEKLSRHSESQLYHGEAEQEQLIMGLLHVMSMESVAQCVSMKRRTHNFALEIFGENKWNKLTSYARVRPFA